jgi:outer membrane protein OmpA-like peptidoglycan-associated protein
MFSSRITRNRGGGGRDDAERPFWISFADLMTALMVLFLVSLSVALNDANKRRDEAVGAQETLKKERQELARAKSELEEEKRKRHDAAKKRNGEVQSFLNLINTVVRNHEGVRFDRERHVVDFGSRALFRRGRNDLTPDQTNALRKFMPELLNVARTDLGQRWLKRIVVEGFASSDWTYLDNLNLSLQRSLRVMCVLMASTWGQAGGGDLRSAPLPPLEPISADDQILISRLFLVGGYSSNSTKTTPEESRRIELRIEFYQLEDLDEGGQPPKQPESAAPVGSCALKG